MGKLGQNVENKQTLRDVLIWRKIHGLSLQVLQSELSVLKHNQARVHELSSYLMLSDPDEIVRVTRSHGGSKATDVQARLDLMHRLQAYIPASVMLPPKRLLTLLDQAAEFQTDRCLRHSLKNHGILAPWIRPTWPRIIPA